VKILPVKDSSLVNLLQNVDIACVGDALGFLS